MRFRSLSAMLLFLFSLSGGQIVLIGEAFSQNVSKEAIRKYMQKHNRSGKGRNFKGRKKRLYEKALRRHGIKPNRRKATKKPRRPIKTKKSGMAGWCKKTFRTCIRANATCQPFLCSPKRGTASKKKQLQQPQLPKFYKKKGDSPLLKKYSSQPQQKTRTAPQKALRSHQNGLLTAEPKRPKRQIYMPGQAMTATEKLNTILEIGESGIDIFGKVLSIPTKTITFMLDIVKPITNHHVAGYENRKKLFDRKSEMTASQRETCFFAGSPDTREIKIKSKYCEKYGNTLPKGCGVCK